MIEILFNKKKESPQFVVFEANKDQGAFGNLWLPKEQFGGSLQVKIQVEVTK
jgi:hypothetical protein